MKNNKCTPGYHDYSIVIKEGLQCAKCNRINYKRKQHLKSIEYNGYLIELILTTKYIPYKVSYVFSINYKIKHSKYKDCFIYENTKHVIYSDVLEKTIDEIIAECKSKIDLYLKETQYAN